MTDRKLKFGIIQTVVLILIHVLFSLTFLIDFMTESFETKKIIIFQISYAYIYVSILTLIRKLVIENKIIVKYIVWIIRFEILKALSSVLVEIGIYQAQFFVTLFGLILLVLYVIFIVNILNKKYKDKIAVKGLRPYVIALIFGFIITLLVGIYAELNHEFEIYGFLYLILAIPYGFIITYFNKMRNRINEMPTGNNI